MMKYRMLAALLAMAITISLAGCAANQNTADSSSEISNQTATAGVSSDTGKSDDATFEAEPTKDTESSASADKSTAEKESNASQSSEPTDTEKPVSSPPTKNEVQGIPKPAPSEPSKQTEAPKKEESKPSNPPVTAPPAEPEMKRPSAEEVARKTVEKINALRMKQGAPAATTLPGLTRVAVLRSEQLITNFSHESSPDACTVLKYGEYVDMTECGLPESSSYYRGYNREAAAKGNWTGTADEITEKIAVGFQNSAGHWSYVGSSEYTYIAVGLTFNPRNSMWYCCVCMSSKNYGG